MDEYCQALNLPRPEFGQPTWSIAPVKHSRVRVFPAGSEFTHFAYDLTQTAQDLLRSQEACDRYILGASKNPSTCLVRGASIYRGAWPWLGITLPADKTHIAQREAARHVKVKRMIGRAQICSDTNLLWGHPVIGNQKVDREQLANSAVRQTNLNSEGALKTIVAAWPKYEIIGPQLGSNKNERKW
jgi:hypothetical protein